MIAFEYLHKVKRIFVELFQFGMCEVVFLHNILQFLIFAFKTEPAELNRCYEIKSVPYCVQITSYRNSSTT